MDIGFGQSIGTSCSGISSNDIGDFECNICFELAEDPIVTLCGHLYCWSCLYRWLHMHSHSHECPVCKALILEEKLVPIYGRGKTSLDPRCRSVPGVDIPTRPTGQRPETAPPPAPYTNYFHQEEDGLIGGFMPRGAARGGNLTLSTAFGELIPFLNLQVHGFNYDNPYGATTGNPYWFPGSFHGGHAHGFHQQSNPGRQRDSFMKMWFLFVGIAVIFYLILS
ncbi:RING finger protein [Actinidia chinensis var. chinensis]|uniref:E3 ubiquitin-protein ligase RMA n=1 Tax=Actinidia chinensis var. chinensis TaxID=1590841 RepID=A0A2R6Q609_ACTCC|nr:RING finger protein [Actinidia chinensis var. chinensis]